VRENVCQRISRIGRGVITRRRGALWTLGANRWISRFRGTEQQSSSAPPSRRSRPGITVPQFAVIEQADPDRDARRAEAAGSWTDPVSRFQQEIGNPDAGWRPAACWDPARCRVDQAVATSLPTPSRGNSTLASATRRVLEPRPGLPAGRADTDQSFNLLSRQCRD